MAYNERTTQLIKLLNEDVSFNDKNQIQSDSMHSVWESNLPENCKGTVIKDLADYRKDFGAAYHHTLGKASVLQASKVEDIGYLSHRLVTDDVDFGFEFTRPEDKNASKDVRRAGLSFRCDVRLSESMGDIIDDVASIWD